MFSLFCFLCYHSYMDKIKKFLEENGSEELAAFNRRLIFTEDKIYGVKIPVLRQEAKKLFGEGVRFCDVKEDSLEEIILKGLLLTYEKEVNEVLEGLTALMSHFDNWASVDVIVPSLKRLAGKRQAFEFFKTCCQSEEEFVCRVGIIGLMRHFVGEEFLENTLEIVSGIDSEKYYIEMAQAWAFCDFFIKNFEKAALFFVKISNFDVKKKCAQKCRDSFRLTREQKEIVTRLAKN